MEILLFPPIAFIISLLFVMLVSGLLSPLAAKPARVEFSGGSLAVRFLEPQLRPAPGQVAALYDLGGVVLAGAVAA